MILRKSGFSGKRSSPECRSNKMSGSYENTHKRRLIGAVLELCVLVVADRWLFVLLTERNKTIIKNKKDDYSLLLFLLLFFLLGLAIKEWMNERKPNTRHKSEYNSETWKASKRNNNIRWHFIPYQVVSEVAALFYSQCIGWVSWLYVSKLGCLGSASSRQTGRGLDL